MRENQRWIALISFLLLDIYIYTNIKIPTLARSSGYLRSCRHRRSSKIQGERSSQALSTTRPWPPPAYSLPCDARKKARHPKELIGHPTPPRGRFQDLIFRASSCATGDGKLRSAMEVRQGGGGGGGRGGREVEELFSLVLLLFHHSEM